MTMNRIKKIIDAKMMNAITMIMNANVNMMNVSVKTMNETGK